MASGELILLVNDIPDHVTAYRSVLAAHGFRVSIARSGQEALALAREAVPECAVIDLRLPDMSGWDLCREMKAHPEQREVPIVVLTPDVSKMCAADSAKAGCNAWLAHPTVAEDLVRTVRRVLHLQEASPSTPEDALIGLTECPACGSDKIRATLRMSPIQYYCCQACSFCWRAEILQPAPAR
jgi:CheY-like chemotaxis protein